MDLIEQTKCFVQERIDEDWVWIIENRVGPWVEQKGNSGYWDCVNIYSQYNGVLKQGLIRIDFAGLIVAIRPKGLKKGKTKEQLKGSMDQCPLSLKLNKIETYVENSECGKIIKELDALFNTPIPQNKQESIVYTVESRLEEYLEKRVATDQYTRILKGETYCGYTTTMSIEKYATEQFMNNKMPSFVLVIECIDGKISDDTISMLVGRYMTDSKIKLIIASSSGFDERVKKLAASRNVRLIRVNPQYEITEKDILTPRMEFSSSVRNYEHKMLSDEVPMTVPLVIMDGYYTTTSLTDFLKRNDIPIKNADMMHAPFLTHEYIENVASQIIKKDVEKFITQLNCCGLKDKVPYCIIDPYKYAIQDHLTIIRTDLSELKHLGHIDIQKKLVRLSNKFEEGDERDRFSMAHEYGHHKLHSHPIFINFLKRYAELTGDAASDIWEKRGLEIQANYFASCMLMPREVVEFLYNLYWRKWFKQDDVRPLYIENQIYWNKDFQNVAAPVARHMGVSLEAIKIRLIQLRLLNDPMEIFMEKVG